MSQVRRSIGGLLGVLALSAVLVPASAMGQGYGSAAVRAQTIRSAAVPVAGTVTQRELPGCSNPSEPFAGPSQGCDSPLYEGGDNGWNPLFGARGPRQTTSLDWSVSDWAIYNGTVWSRRELHQTLADTTGTFDPGKWASRGPRQTTSLDGRFNLQTGAISRTAGDLTIPERGPDLSPDPTYNSALASTAGVMGYGWSFPYSMSLRIYRGTATITQENGSRVVFKLGSDKRFHALPRVIASLAQTSSGSYTLTRGSSRSTCPSYLLRSCEAFTFNKGHLTRVSGRSACKSTEVCGNGIVDIAYRGGRPTTATADSGDKLTFGYTAGHITSITGLGGILERFTYDLRGNLTSATDPNGNTTHYAYDRAHRLTSVSDPLGRTTLYAYSGAGRLTHATDPAGHQTTFHYDGVHHTTAITSPEGRRTTLSFVARQLVNEAAGLAGKPPLAEWTYAYSPRTLAGTRAVDPAGNVTTTAGDPDGLPLAVTDALGHVTTFTYNDAGRRASLTDPMGVTTKFTYDENGNLLTRSTPVVASGVKRVETWISVFEDAVHPGDMTASIDPLGNETDYTYDAHGNPASVTDPLGNTWSASGNQICGKTNHLAPRKASAAGAATITDPLGHTNSWTCDANGNVLTTKDGNGATTTYTYDADNELTSTTDPVGRKTTYSYDADGRLTAIRMPDGTTSHATYGADGELLTTVDPAGGTRSFTYDALGHMASSTDQLGRKKEWTVDSTGDVISVTDAAGVTTTHTYDADRRELKTHFENGDIPTEEQFAYDLDGRRISMTDATGTTTYQYDSLGRVTQVVDGSGHAVETGYNLAGDRTSLQYPNGHTVTMQYDANGRMTSVKDWLGNTSQFDYDAAGRLSGSRVYDPTKSYTAGDTAVYNTSLQRNAGGQVIHIQVKDAFGNATAGIDYTRAPDGRITSVDSTGLGDPHHAYTYDANGRLASYDGSPVAFDSRDNVTQLPDGSTLNYDAADQITSMQTLGLSSTFSYDADGRRIASGSAASGRTFGWNAAGDLTSFTDNGTTTTYTVNGDGQRMSSSSGGVTHSLVWSPRSNRLVWSPRSNVLLSDGDNSFIYGPDGLPVEQIDNADNALFLGTDAEGTVRWHADVSGNLKGTASYDAFGNPTAQTGETSPFGFHGMYLDTESGLYALSGGVYDPATGQNLTDTARKWGVVSATGSVVYVGTWDVRVGNNTDLVCHADAQCMWDSGRLRGGGRRPDDLVFNVVNPRAARSWQSGDDLVSTSSPYTVVPSKMDSVLNLIR